MDLLFFTRERHLFVNNKRKKLVHYFIRNLKAVFLNIIKKKHATFLKLILNT